MRAAERQESSLTPKWIAAGYQIVEQIYRGRRTQVARAIELATETTVVIKMLPVDSPARHVAKLKRELSILQKLEHPGVPAPRGLICDQSRWVLVMDDMAGTALAQLFAEGRSMSRQATQGIDPFFDIALQLCDVLELIHDHGLIHGQIHPGHILWSESNAQSRLIDFGRAGELSRELPGSCRLHGLGQALHFISPEQTGRMNRLVDYRSDLYSLGATLYWMLAGRPPFNAAGTLELVHSHLAKTANFSPVEKAAGPKVAAVLSRLLAKNAEDRYQTIHGLRQDLKKCRADQTLPYRQAPFIAGLNDHCGVFQIPQKLYGRDKEIEALLAAFDRCESGSRETILVAGYSGVGKSAVAYEVQKPITGREGFFATGKFDQYEQDVPYSGLAQAFDDIVRQLLAEPASSIDVWCRALKGCLGRSASVMVELVPALSLILGETEVVEDLPPLESTNRLNEAVGRFVKALTSNRRPLVLFLDDLQWADQPTLQVIKILMKDPATRHLMIIGAYRDTGVPTEHHLTELKQDLERHHLPLQVLTLNPLALKDVTCLIAETLVSSPQDCAQLAGLCYRKTQGNPFFLDQFLRAIHEAGYLTYCKQQNRWIWNTEDIEQADFTDNVVELLVRRINRFPADARRLLQIAASMGNQIELKTLSMVSGREPWECQEILWPALESDFIRPLSVSYKYLSRDSPAPRVVYRFLHDRAQQAAYDLASEEEKKRRHLTIGRRLWAAGQDLESSLFNVVAQLNSGRDLLRHDDERMELSQLNYRAGKKALLSSAYPAAAGFMAVGIELLLPEPWDNCFEATLELHLGAAQAFFLCGDFDSAEALYPEILKHCTQPLDQVRCFMVQGQHYQLQGRFLEVIALQRRGLALLNVEVPASCQDIQTVINEGYQAIDRQCAHLSIEAIMDHKEMTDAEGLAIMNLLFGMWYASHLAGFSDLNVACTVVMTQISLEYGLSDVAPFGFVNYAYVLGSLRDDRAAGYSFGRMAVELSNRRQNKVIRGSTYFLFATFTNHWSAPLSTSNRFYDEAFDWSLESGDLATIGYIVAVRATDRVIEGRRPLPELLGACERDLMLLEKNNQLDMVDCLRVGALQPIRNLMAATHGPATYDDEHFQESRFLAQYAEKPLHLANFFHGKIRNAYLLDTARAAKWVERLGLVQKYLPGQCKIPEAVFYAALIHLRELNRAESGNDSPRLGKVQILCESLRRWATACPANYGAKSLLVEAQWAQLKGDPQEAFGLYSQAVEAAHDTECLALEALAHELLGELCLEQGQACLATTFLQRSQDLFQTWGARAKVEQISRKYQLSPPGATRLPGSHVKADDHAGSLDIRSILEAGQAVSSDLGLAGVLEKVIRILRKISGAQSVKLLLLRDGQWLLEGDAGEQGIQVLQSSQLDLDSADSTLPYSLLRFVSRTGEEVIEDEISISGQFAGDPYFRDADPKAVMCLPITRFSRPAGIVYFENRLTAGVFTRDRARFARVLIGQAIISIDNARLYQRVEEHNRTLGLKVEERTRELLTIQERLVAQERLASMGTLTAGVAHEIRNPLSLVVNFARLSAQISLRLEDGLGAAGLMPEEGDEIHRCLEDLRLNVAKIEEHGQRASNIIGEMLLHSRQSDRPWEYKHIPTILKRAAHHICLGSGPRRGLQNLVIEEDFEAEIEPVHVSASDLTRAFVNLVSNSAYAMSAKRQKIGADYTPRLRLKARKRAQYLELRIRDNGVGIPREVLAKVCDPFFTTKPAGDGTGLGLSICHDIIFGTHQGWIRVESVEGEHTEVVLALPWKSRLESTSDH